MSEQTVIARYLTIAGQTLHREDLTVDITHTNHSGILTTTCTNCQWDDHTTTGSRATDPPEKEDDHIERALPEARTIAQAHANVCRAIRGDRTSRPTTPWPEGVTHRYENLVKATVDIRKDRDGATTARCTGCPYTRTDHVGDGSGIHRDAQAHAEKCRGQRRPAVQA